jgi:sec-independent protein translocase protein TatA
MISDLFDSPWKILILAVVILVLFGSKKLPDAARSLGKSMRILKTEITEMHDEDPAQPIAAPSAAQPSALAQPQNAAHQQIEALQQQLDDLRGRRSPADGNDVLLRS